MPSFTLGTGVWLEYVIETRGQFPDNNYSDLRVTCILKSSSSGNTMNITGKQKLTIKVDNFAQDLWVPAAIRPNSSQTLGYHEFRAGHNVDGKKTAKVTVSYAINNYVSGVWKGTVSGSSNYTIKTIPRATTLTVAATNLPSRDIKITTKSPAGGSAQNKLSIYINNVWQTDIIKWGSGTWAWSMSDDKVRSFIRAMGYATTYQIKVVCTTIISGTNIGNNTATNNLKNIVKPTLTATKAKYDILNDDRIKLTGGSYAAGMTYSTSTSTPALGTISLEQVFSSESVRKLIDKYKELDKINDLITVKMDIKFNNVVCRTEIFTPASIYASTKEFISNLTHATVSFQLERDTESWYPLTMSVVESGKVASRIMSLMRLTVSVPSANAEISGAYVPGATPTTLQASRLDLERIATLDDGTNDFRYTVNARIYFSLYDLLIYENNTTLLVLKRDVYEVNENSTGTLGSIGTKVFTSKWESYSEYLNNLFYSKSPVPQFFYIPILDRIPSWTLENELGEEVKSPLPTKTLFDKVMKNGVDDDYTLTMMYLLCMFEGNRDTSFYCPNNFFKTSINAQVKIKQLVQLDTSGNPTVNYTGADDITITKHYSHPTSGIPTFETDKGIKLASYVGHYKFEGIEEVRIMPVNIEEFYDPSPQPEPPAIFDGTKAGDMLHPSAFYRKESNGTFVQMSGDYQFYVVGNDETQTYGISMYKYSSTDKTLYYCRQRDATSGIYTASSMHSLDWYTDGKSNMAFRVPIEETFTVRGYAGGIPEIRSGDTIQIASSAKSSYGLSNDLVNLTKRFYQCLYKVQLQRQSSNSLYAYWVVIDGLYKLILAQDVVGTKEYYKTFFGGVEPKSTPVYTSVKMTANTPPEYYTWKPENVVTTIIEDDIQLGLYQCTVGQYTPPQNMAFRQYVENDDVVLNVIVLSTQDLLVYLKQDLPETDLVIKVAQEDLFNKSYVTLTKLSPKPYLFMDTELKSVGLLQYPTKTNSVEFPK